MKIDQLRKEVLMRMNAFTITYFNFGLDDDQLVKDQSEDKLNKLARSNDVLNKYMIKYFWKYHKKDINRKSLGKLMNKYGDYISQNYIDDLLNKYPSVAFQHFNTIYVTNPNKVENYLEKRYGKKNLEDIIGELSQRS